MSGGGEEEDGEKTDHSISEQPPAKAKTTAQAKKPSVSIKEPPKEVGFC